MTPESKKTLRTVYDLTNRVFNLNGENIKPKIIRITSKRFTIVWEQPGLDSLEIVYERQPH